MRPMWRNTIRLGDVWRNDEMTFAQRRDAIVSRLRDSRWAQQDVLGELADVLDDLAHAETTLRFDEAWDHLYDLADEDRVWIDLYGPRTPAAAAPKP